MTPDLDRWLQQATRSLSKDSAAQVHTEIQEHYQSAREAAIRDGAPRDEANRMALTALGDAKIANTQCRRVLLTASEARLLQQVNREAEVVCSISWRQWLLLAVSLIAIFPGRAGRLPLLRNHLSTTMVLPVRARTLTSRSCDDFILGMLFHATAALVLSAPLVQACDCITLPAKEAKRGAEVVFRATITGFRDSSYS